jgi:hypothetical protein
MYSFPPLSTISKIEELSLPVALVHIRVVNFPLLTNPYF